MHTFAGRGQQPLAEEAPDYGRSKQAQSEAEAGCCERSHQHPRVGCWHLLAVPPVAACSIATAMHMMVHLPQSLESSNYHQNRMPMCCIEIHFSVELVLINEQADTSAAA